MESAEVERSSQALIGFERELNVINPEEKTNILAARLLQLNIEYTNAQGDRLKKEAANDSVKGEFFKFGIVGATQRYSGQVESERMSACDSVNTSCLGLVHARVHE